MMISQYTINGKVAKNISKFAVMVLNLWLFTWEYVGMHGAAPYVILLRLWIGYGKSCFRSAHLSKKDCKLA